MEWPITVWDEPRLVYVSVPKAANTAVKAALLSSFVHNQRWRNPHAATMPYVEATKDELRERYRDHLTFTVGRDPFDRFVSFWSDKIAGNGWYPALGRQGFAPGMGFEDAAVVAAALPDATTDPHLRSQHERLTHPDGSIAVQLVLRFEDLDADWQGLRRIVANRAGGPLAALEIRRQSVHLAPGHYFTPRAAEAIRDRYRPDFELLGYPTTVDSTVCPGTTPLHRLHELVGEAPDTVVIDAAGPDVVRRNLVRAAGGVYLARGGCAGWHVASLIDAVHALDGTPSVVVLHDGSSDQEVATLPSWVRLVELR